MICSLVGPCCYPPLVGLLVFWCDLQLHSQRCSLATTESMRFVIFLCFGPWRLWHDMRPLCFFFPAYPDLVDMFGRTDFDFDSFYILFVLDPKFPDFLDSQISRFPYRGLGHGPWARDTQSICPDSSATATRCLRTTKLVRSKELGQYRENPISSSPVWGM